MIFWGIFLAFIFGLIFGSFSAALIYRLYHEESGMLGGRSHCDHCREVLHFFSLIPLFSWIFQRGKCRNCAKEISYFYPLIELSVGLLFAFLFYWFFPRIPSESDAILIFILWGSLIIFWYDVWFLTVDRRIVFPLCILAILWHLLHGDSLSTIFLGGLLGGVFYFVQFFYSKGRWVGAGDIDLGIFLGLCLGARYWLLGLFFAYILGSVWVGLLALRLFFKGQKISQLSQKKLPLGAFLMLSNGMFLLWGEVLWNWYFNIFMSPL